MVRGDRSLMVRAGPSDGPRRPVAARAGRMVSARGGWRPQARSRARWHLIDFTDESRIFSGSLDEINARNHETDAATTAFATR